MSIETEIAFARKALTENSSAEVRALAQIAVNEYDQRSELKKTLNEWGMFMDEIETKQAAEVEDLVVILCHAGINSVTLKRLLGLKLFQGQELQRKLEDIEINSRSY